MAFTRFVPVIALALAVTGCSSDAEDVTEPAGAVTSAVPSAGAPSSPAVPDRAVTPSAAPEDFSTAAGGAVASPDGDDSGTDTSGVVLTSGGVEIGGRAVPFGTPYDELAPELREALGAPSRDEGEGSVNSPYGICPGTVLRAVEHAGGAAVFLFGDVGGPGTRFYSWTLRDEGDAQEAPAVHVGDDALDVRIGTTVAELREGADADALSVSEGDELSGPSFTLEDTAGELPGLLTDTSPTGTVTQVTAGQSCGE